MQHPYWSEKVGQDLSWDISQSLSARNWNLAKMRLALTWKTMPRSGHNFAHATTADFLWHHVKNFMSWYGYDFYDVRTTRIFSRFHLWAQKSLVKWGQATACSWRLMTCGITSSLRGNYMMYKGTSNWILIIKAFAITFLSTENGQVLLLPTWFNFNPSMDI